jgi:hypothetical protein
MENNNRGPGASPVLGNVDGERVVEKLKGYFSLGKSEIDKAIRADEWGEVANSGKASSRGGH